MKEFPPAVRHCNPKVSITLVLVLTLLVGFQSYAQTIANNLLDLRRYLDDSNVNVKLAPGTYWIRANDVEDGLYGNASLDIYGRVSRALLPIAGNNSTYDFTGVTINVETAVFDVYGSGAQIYEVHTTGNNNVLKNLTLVDVGSVDDFPPGGANSIVMDGRNNRIEDFNVTIKGSYPYGYGDAFGKGGSWTIRHRKHSACLVRGESNHVKNSTFIHRAYGHCIYMQAASNPTIEGCYVEGEMRSTDDMLREAGTGSPADDIDFMTVWGYKLPAGYMMSTGEAGIRAYNAGETIIDGRKYEGIGTSNPTVINCTVKNMRTGVTLAHASGTKYVEGCMAIGCENGFSLGAGEVLNCKADVAFGPAYSSTYQNDRNYDADITIIEAENGFYYNGAKSVAYMGGSSHHLTLTGTGANIPSNYTVKIGGAKGIVRLLGGNSPNQNNLTASNNIIENTTGASITIISGSNNNDIETCGATTNRGSGNSIARVSCDEEEVIIITPPVSGNFTPDPNKTYYLDVPQHNVRLAANGESEAPYTTSTTTTGADVEWQFVQADDRWYLRRAAGGSKPGLRTDNSASADMQSTGSTGGWTKYAITDGASSGTYFLTIPNGPADYKRLQIDRDLNINMVEDTRNGSWESFQITEASSSTNSGTMPQAGKTYYIDNPHWDARLAANGGATPYLKDPNANYGNLVSWRLTAAPTAGYYYIDGVGGEDTPRLSTDLTENAAVRSASFGGSWTQWKLTPMGDGSFTLTTLVAGDFCRLQVTDTGEIKMVSAAYAGDWTRFTFTESRSAKSLADLDSNFATVYPNPIATSTTIEGAADTTLTIYNMNGSLLHSQSISSESETIDLSGLATGVYYAEIRGATKIDIVKLVKL